MTSIDIATAPVSFGVWAPDHGSDAAYGRAAVAAMAAAGFAGAELGPPGIFGSPETCAALYAEHGLAVLGAYAEFELAGTESAFAAGCEALDRTCAELAAAGGGMAVLADAGDSLTRANPARTPDHAVRWSDRQWELCVARLGLLTERLDAVGIDASFHPHIGTYVENRREIEILLDRTELDLTLDTGHFQLAGIEPAAALEAYRARINHVHVKDVRAAGLPQPEGLDLDDWWSAAMSPLGKGDVDLAGCVEQILALGLRWVVIEQDRDPTPIDALDDVSRAEDSNRRWLASALENACTHHTERGD